MSAVSLSPSLAGCTSSTSILTMPNCPLPKPYLKESSYFFLTFCSATFRICLSNMSVRDGLTKKTAVLLDFDQITLQTSLTNVIGLVTSHSHFCQGDGYQFFNWQVCILDALMVSKYDENCFIWLFFSCPATFQC